MKPKILVVDDELDALEVLGFKLREAGFTPIFATDGLKALAAIRAERPDLVVLDLMLPELDGLEVCKLMRRDPATAGIPVLMLTAKAAEMDRVVGLELGADDYVTKPFSPRELVLRVQAILRRNAPPTNEQGISSFGDGVLLIDEPRRVAGVRGNEVELTPTEWGILVALATVPGRVYSRFELINRVRGYDFEGYERTIDSHVKNLRRKIEEDPSNPVIIQTVLGGGYRLGLNRDG
jgi:two-component system phosphate regulon response regulator PhoB